MTSVFQACRQNGSQTGKNLGYNKLSAAMIISHFKRMLMSFLGK